MIELRNINKSFKKFHVLKDISLNIKSGECVVLSGISGSAKSTLLSIIGSLLKPSSGTIFVDNLEINKLNDFRLSDFRRNIVGIVPQSFELFEMLSVRENILPALLVGEVKDVSSRIDEVLSQAQILHKKDAQVKTLSGGEKQRCIIARALVNNPKILLFDEPTANLDRENTLKFSAILKELKLQGKTMIIATHDTFICDLDFVDRVINMKEGAIE